MGWEKAMNAARWVGRVSAVMLVAVASTASVLAEEPAVGTATALLAVAMGAEDEGPRLQAMELAAGLSTPGLEAAARRAAASNDRVERTWALELLARIDVARNQTVFVDAMASPYRSVRVRAVLALGSLKDPRVTGPLTSMLERDADPDLRALAAKALGATGGQDARSALRRALDDPHPAVKMAAVIGLVQSGDTEVGFDLLSHARKTEKGEACRLLGLVGRVPNRELIAGLAELLSSETPEVRIAAAAAILSIDEHAR